MKQLFAAVKNGLSDSARVALQHQHGACNYGANHQSEKRVVEKNTNSVPDFIKLVKNMFNCRSHWEKLVIFNINLPQFRIKLFYFRSTIRRVIYQKAENFSILTISTGLTANWLDLPWRLVWSAWRLHLSWRCDLHLKRFKKSRSLLVNMAMVVVIFGSSFIFQSYFTKINWPSSFVLLSEIKWILLLLMCFFHYFFLPWSIKNTDIPNTTWV